MYYQFPCPECGFEMEVRTLKRGWPIPCEQCGEVVKVPADAGPPGAALPAGGAGDEADGFLGPLPGLCGVLGFVHFVCGILGGIFLLGDNGWLGIAAIASGVIWGSVFFGVGQLVRMLMRMNDRIRDIQRNGARA